MSARRFIFDLSKLKDYMLSDKHPGGRNKARVFRSALGLKAEDAEWLRTEILRRAAEFHAEFVPTRLDQYGQRYQADFTIEHEARIATVRTAWVASTGEDQLNFVTCHGV